MNRCKLAPVAASWGPSSGRDREDSLAGTLIELHDILHEGEMQPDTMLEMVCRRLSTLLPGVTVFIGEIASGLPLAVRSAAGPRASLLEKLVFEWNADVPAEGARFSASQADALGSGWATVFTLLKAGELVAHRLRVPGQGGLLLGTLSPACGLPTEGGRVLLQGAVRMIDRAFAAQSRNVRMERENGHLRLAALVFEYVMEGVVITDPSGRILAVNEAVTRVTGYDKRELVGATPGLLKSGRHGDEFYRGMWAALEQDGRWQGEIWNRRKNGEVYPQILSVSAVRDAESISHYIGIFIDISRQKEAENRLDHLSRHDSLTGLLNRERFRQRLDQVLAGGRRHALLLLDIDRFNQINDTLGNADGDLLLDAVAQRLRGNVRAGDLLARMGGDEYAMLLRDIAGCDDASLVAEKIRQSLDEPVSIAGLRLPVTVSIGLSLFPDDGIDGDVLLRQADAALNKAKRQGGNACRFYVPEYNAELRQRLERESELRYALERGELELFYQPQVSLESGRVTGVEGLLRWRKPGHGLIAPGQFIPLAEENGLIVPIGAWVLRQACRQGRAWHDAGHAGLVVAVNLSARQLRDGMLVDKVASALAESGLPAAALELELTESLAMESVENSADILGRLRELGVRLSIDDFGTGYCSLTYLRRYPVDKLKIDRQFVAGMLRDANDAAIVKAIIGLAGALGLSVLAEGVETAEELAFLREAGCDEIQGFYFGQPLPGAELDLAGSNNVLPSTSGIDNRSIA